jgi:hypothetical protein
MRKFMGPMRLIILSYLLFGMAACAVMMGKQRARTETQRAAERYSEKWLAASQSRSAAQRALEQARSETPADQTPANQ